jgi:hypothetical protein
MFKRISSILIAALLVLAVPMAVMAALPVDEANVKADNFQENGHEPFKMFLTDPIGDGVRFAGHVNPDSTGDLEEGEPVMVDGSATMSVTIPFTQTVNVESFNIRFINAARQYFFLVYSSMDGATWTDVNVASNGAKGIVDPTSGPFGPGDGPAKELFVTVPAGNDDDGGINTLNFAFAAPVTANFIKITFYGNDNATGDLAVGNQWLSFNNLSFEGSIYVPEEAPVESDLGAGGGDPVDIPAPVVSNAPAAPAGSAAPPTADPISLIVLGSIISAAGLAIVKRRK